MLHKKKLFKLIKSTMQNSVYQKHLSDRLKNRGFILLFPFCKILLCSVEKTLTSARFCSWGAAMKTTYGANSAVRKTLRACGSTSRIAILPSSWIFRIVSSFVPYIASSWVPASCRTKFSANNVKNRTNSSEPTVDRIETIHYT